MLIQWIDAVDSNDADFDEVTEEERKKVLGYGMTKEECEDHDAYAYRRMLPLGYAEIAENGVPSGHTCNLCFDTRKTEVFYTGDGCNVNEEDSE